MATLEERIQNLTQDIRPIETEMVMDMVDKTKGPISNREMEIFRSAVPSSPIGSGVMSDNDMVRINKALLSGIQDPMMSNVDTSVMQPLVDLGFEQQVRTIMTYPQNSPESMQAQQEILSEMGTGMDVDAFVQTVKEVAPKEIQEEILQDRMMPVSGEGDEGIMALMSTMGRDGDTTLGHLTEGEVVIPAPVLEANPQASDMLEQTMTQMGIDPRTRVVDSTGQLGGIASINPETGFQEFGFLSKLWKKTKNIVKKAAPILPFIPGVGPALSGVLGSAGSAIAGGLSKIPVVGGALSKGATFLGQTATGKLKGLPSLLQRDPNDQGTTNPLIKGIGDLLGFGGRSAELERLINPATKLPYTDAEIQAMSDQQKADAIAQGRATQGGTTLPSKVSEMFNETQIDDQGNIVKGGMGTGGKFALAGLAGLLGKLAYEEAKDQKGVPLTPLTQMDPLGRYNIEAEIARRTGAEMPSRVEFGLTPEGMPALSGGKPRNARYGGIMAFADGGVVAMAEGGDMDVAINVEEFPVRDGQINGAGTETSDDIPAMLSDGEFVMTAKAVRGAGSFDVNNNNGILTLTPNGEPTRDSGTRVMYKLMEHFGNVA